ncbi:MAG TPA: Wzz/FepE/Etk N-terminal domain-containing protein [Candidatus Limnocylindrales bacterium]|nr:Wzz/FepE/Etk N-terminal domain-containing protein [Candidatus Limnocylindrales bacterium]
MELSAVASATRRYLRMILVLCIGAGLAAYFVSSLLPKRYEAEARVFVGSLTAANYDQQLAYQQLAQTYAQLATTTPILEKVVAELGLKDTAAQLATRVDVRTPTGLSIIRIETAATTAEEAAAIANTIAGQVTALAEPASGGAGLASIVQTAAPPPSPSSPRAILNALVAAALALAVGIGLALFLDGRTAKSEEKAVAASQAAVTW